MRTSYGQPTIYGGHRSWSCQSSSTRQKPARGVKGPENLGIFATSATFVGDWAVYWSPSQPENAPTAKAQARSVNMGTAARVVTAEGGPMFCPNKCQVSSAPCGVRPLFNVNLAVHFRPLESPGGAIPFLGADLNPAIMQVCMGGSAGIMAKYFGELIIFFPMHLADKNIF